MNLPAIIALVTVAPRSCTDALTRSGEAGGSPLIPPASIRRTPRASWRAKSTAQPTRGRSASPPSRCATLTSLDPGKTRPPTMPPSSPSLSGSRKRGASLPVQGDGLRSRDFTYIDNVVAANLAAAESTAEGVAVNINAGHQHSLMDLIGLIERHLSHPVTRVHEPARAGDVRHTQEDISLAPVDPV